MSPTLPGTVPDVRNASQTRQLVDELLFPSFVIPGLSLFGVVNGVRLW